ncbi:unannotated protein [freshwater metagenome]
MSVLVSPESPRMCSIGCSRTPPAALISATARSMPANSGGPRNARLPVSGSSEPIFNGPVPFTAAASSAGAASSSEADFEQPAKTKLATANAATTLSFFEICIISLSDIFR